ncbi:hypothetical protein AB0912_16020 [Streptomyces sp. NPDC007084]|uniref:hypothetical protein n=1 Tax=Streptomyces sp. NPDC007084 TaxID=3154313 RepID=UPI003453CCC7
MFLGIVRRSEGFVRMADAAEEQTGISSDAWIRWYTHGELPEREAPVAFFHVASLTQDDHVLLLGLGDAAHDVLEVQKRSASLPSSISCDEA